MHSLRFFALAVAASALAVGCSSPTGTPTKMGVAPKSPPSATGTPGETPPFASTAPDQHLPKTTVKSEPPLQITPPGKDNWKPPAAPLAIFVRDADTAIRSLQNAYLATLLIVENGELKGSINGEWDFFDRGKHRIEYELPDDPSRPRILLAKDGRRYENVENGLKPFTDRLPSGPTLLANFPSRFPQYWSFACANGDDLWARLIGAAKASSAAYPLTYEARPMDVGGTSVTFHRILISPTARPGETWEVRFEGNRKLPVTFKVQGPTSSTQWNLKWSFSKPLDESKIQLPTK